jgi:hypothetical protein
MTTPEQPSSLRDWGLSWIRTGVPVLWGLVLTFLASRAPAVYDLVNNPYLAGLAVSLATVAWYSLARWLEPKLPPWLTRLVIGANSTPRYGVEPPGGRSTA